MPGPEFHAIVSGGKAVKRRIRDLILRKKASCQAFDFNDAVGIMVSRNGRLTVGRRAIARSLELGVAAMSVAVAASLLVQVPHQRFGEVDSRLVGQTNCDEQDVRQFVG